MLGRNTITKTVKDKYQMRGIFGMRRYTITHYINKNTNYVTFLFKTGNLLFIYFVTCYFETPQRGHDLIKPLIRVGWEEGDSTKIKSLNGS
jgi:hypothetical protein